MDVFFYEAFAEEVTALRGHLPANIAADFTGQTIQEAGHSTPPAKLISIRTQSVIPTSWQLTGIVSRTTGYDHLVSAPCPAGYLPQYCTRAVAEQAALLWLALLRKLPRQIAQFSQFNRDGLTGNECVGKHLLVVGAGHIGSEIVAIGRALGMDVRRVDIIPARADVSINDGLPWADIIVNAMNLTPQNAGYFRYEQWRQVKRGALFVNIARGEHAPMADLQRALDEELLGGIALDVFDKESELAVALRAGKTNVLLADYPNVICTPHNAFNSWEGVERKARQTVQQIERFLKTGQFLWPVPAG